MRNQRVFLFAQSTDNKNKNDYFVYQNNQLETIHIDEKCFEVHSLLNNITEKGKEIHKGNVKGYYIQDDKAYHIVFLIDHNQKDHVGRRVDTALIMLNIQDININFSIEDILRQFWQLTNRNSELLEISSKNCLILIPLIVKRKISVYGIIMILVILVLTILSLQYYLN